MCYLCFFLSYVYVLLVGDVLLLFGVLCCVCGGVSWFVLLFVVVLLLWMLILFVMMIWYLFLCYNLLNLDVKGFVGFDNYCFFVIDLLFLLVIWYMFVLIGVVFVIIVVGGVLMVVLFDCKFYGQGVVCLFVIVLFFVMLIVFVLIWKNMILYLVYGFVVNVMCVFGMMLIDWFVDYLLIVVIIIVVW